MIEHQALARAHAISLERRTSAARHAAVLRAKPTLWSRLRAALLRRDAARCGCPGGAC